MVSILPRVRPILSCSCVFHNRFGFVCSMCLLFLLKQVPEGEAASPRKVFVCCLAHKRTRTNAHTQTQDGRTFWEKAKDMAASASDKASAMAASAKEALSPKKKYGVVFVCLVFVAFPFRLSLRCIEA